MSFKKFIISILFLGTVISGTSLYYSKQFSDLKFKKSKIEKNEERKIKEKIENQEKIIQTIEDKVREKKISSERKEDAAEMKKEKIAENKEILNSIFDQCQNSSKSVMKDENSWNRIYKSLKSSHSSSFSCGSKQVILRMNSSDNNDERIFDTTERWWPDEEEKDIFIEIQENDDNKSR